jgi:hypothetical protein
MAYVATRVREATAKRDTARFSDKMPEGGAEAMVEHRPWVGKHYSTIGIEGQRLAIVGHSHWGDDDSDGATEEVVSRVISGEWSISFFTSIRNYFGYDDHDEFWHRVLFF